MERPKPLVRLTGVPDDDVLEEVGVGHVGRGPRSNPSPEKYFKGLVSNLIKSI